MQNNQSKKILWICGTEKQKFTGVGYYSESFLKELRKRGYNLETLYNKYFLHPIAKYFYKLCVLPIYIWFISKRYDFVILWNDDLSILGPFIRTKKTIIIHHVQRSYNLQNTFNEKTRFIDNMILRKFLRFFDRVITNSDHTKQELLKFHYLDSNCKITTIYNPIHSQKDMPERLSKEKLLNQYNIPFSSEIKYLLYVGSEESRKNVITLLKLLKELPENEYVLIKIGKAISYSNREKHLNYLKENHMNHVFMIDSVPEEELSLFFQYADLFLFPSLFEGFGRPPVEAQAHGLPVISTTNGALKEVLQDSVYAIKDPLNIEEWKIALIALQNTNLKQQLVNKGFENARRFSISSQTNKWDQFLKENY